MILATLITPYLGPGLKTNSVPVSDRPGVQVGDVCALPQQVSPVVNCLPGKRIPCHVQNMKRLHPCQDINNFHALKTVV